MVVSVPSRQPKEKGRMNCQECHESAPDPLPWDWFFGWHEETLEEGVYCPKHVSDETRLDLLEVEFEGLTLVSEDTPA